MLSAPAFSEEMTTITMVVSEMNHPFPENRIEKEKETAKKNAFHAEILSREKTLAGGNYSVTVPVGQLIALPSLMHPVEKNFWRDILQKFTNYNFPTYPIKDMEAVKENINDTVWLSFLLSRYSDLDLLLYLKCKTSNYPLIVLLKNGKIFAADFQKFTRFKDSSKDDLIVEDLSGGSCQWKEWMTIFEQSLVEGKMENEVYIELKRFFSNVSKISTPPSPFLKDALSYYKSDVNSIRRDANLSVRSVFNEGEYMFIKTPQHMVSFSLMELYHPEELPAIVSQLMYSMWHSCVTPGKNKFPSLEDLKKYAQITIEMHKNDKNRNARKI